MKTLFLRQPRPRFPPHRFFDILVSTNVFKYSLMSSKYKKNDFIFFRFCCRYQKGLLIKTKFLKHNLIYLIFPHFQFFYKISSSKSSNIIVLVLAQIMGMYFCSSVLLMRMNMPAEYRTIITEVLGGLHFNFYHRWFDVIFLVSALTTIVILYLLHKPPNVDTSM
uniref:Golgi pH regulator n=2 Tax=Culex pipiens TaxID=7175 RepID=A0A8D8ALQ4_CULPI